MKFSIDWLENAANAAPEENATIASLRIFIKNQNITEHRQRNEQNNDHIAVSMYGLAEGLVYNWWSIFGTREQSTQLRYYRCGYLLPDIHLAFDGSTFKVWTDHYSYPDADLSFAASHVTETMSRQHTEDILSTVIADVLQRLDARDCKNTGLHLRWQRVRASSKSAAERSFCEAAGSLGLDPYQIPDEEASFIESAERLFSEPEALIEFTAGSRHVNKERLMRWAMYVLESNQQPQYQLANLNSITRSVGNASASAQGSRAWATGYRNARAVRRILDLSQATPLRTYRDLAVKFGATHSFALAPQINGINAIRHTTQNSTNVYLRNHGTSASAQEANLFSLARAIGDAVCFPDISVSPVNALKNAYRQAAGRAFAAEFLAPSDEIQNMLSDENDVDTIADNFGVSAQTIQLQIENRTRITESCQ